VGVISAAPSNRREAAPAWQPLTVVAHEGRDAVRKSLPTWRALLAHGSSTMPFAQPAWASAWQSVYGSHHAALMLEFHRLGQPVALAALQVTRYPPLGTRRLEFLGGGPMTRLQWALNPRHFGQSFYNDLIVTSGHEAATLAALRHWLAAHSRRWDELNLTCVPSTSPLATGFPRVACGWTPRVEVEERCFVDTSLGWGSYRSALSKRQQRHLRYEPHALARAAGAEPSLVVLRGGDVPAAMEAFLRLYHRRWAAEGRQMMPRRNWTLYRRLAVEAELHPVFYCLDAGGRPLAMQFGFDDGRRYIPFAFAFEPSLARTSPANVLIHYAIRRCCDDGHDEVDLVALADADRWAASRRRRLQLGAISPRLSAEMRARGLDLMSRALIAAQQTTAGRRGSAAAGRARLAMSRR
jgi:CelD/BcsL family acetyltransferase involved in cellulose biosynthesis